jgi:hypothetical protein
VYNVDRFLIVVNDLLFLLILPLPNIYVDQSVMILYQLDKKLSIEKMLLAMKNSLNHRVILINDKVYNKHEDLNRKEE